MLARADGIRRAAYALQSAESGNILLAHVCESEGSAHTLKRQMEEHLPHLGSWTVVPVLITVTAARDVAGVLMAWEDR